jgi:hypothetical protein
VYAGDFNNNKLIVISKELENPKYIDLKSPKMAGGILIKNDSILIIAFYYGYLCAFCLTLLFSLTHKLN